MNDDERIDLVRRLFALATAKAEDAAELAAQGQRRYDQLDARHFALALRLQSLSEEILLIAEAISALSQDVGVHDENARETARRHLR